MAQMKTPGVYIQEKNAFGNSIVEVATAVPVFIGYTEIAMSNGKSILNQPWPISSLSEFETYFGGAPVPSFEFQEVSDKSDGSSADTPFDILGEHTYSVKTESTTKYKIVQSSNQYFLYYCMQLFFQNGGGNCYIMSVGDYSSTISQTDFTNAFGPLEKEEEPTIVVMPDAVLLDQEDCYAVEQQALLHCGTMQNRVAIVDIWNGYQDLNQPSATTNQIDNFRNSIGTNFLEYSMAYYPWLNTSNVSEGALLYSSLSSDSLTTLQNLIMNEFTPVPDSTSALAKAIANLTKTDEELVPGTPAKPEVKKGDKVVTPATDAKPATPAQINAAKKRLSQTLLSVSTVYKNVLSDMATILNTLPPSAAMAGVYTMVDNTQGVWKAPANVSLNSVIAPTVTISNQEQQNLNMPLDGKAVNAIRVFKGEGTMVWGARTLDGNSQDWRYINVRRTMIMLEQSIKDACKVFVFDANDAHTWLSVETMITAFLTTIWSQGGLAGSSAAEAFSVAVGLGKTMNADDILNGIMKVVVLVAITHPAEFIQITFEQEMQKG
ncbi:phage tail sheath family protein [Zooshikella sp. RANM57]|uniref:phage tail sheath family protein n=1 Tax=Zooshikella sp. RANM57 TaxID=3425863 RepID=UPI003D6F90F2